MSRKTQNKCDIFCFQQCSDKYEDLILKKHQNLESTKVSLKKSQSKNNQFPKIIINTRSQSQKDLHHPWKTSTNRSRDQKNGNIYDIELFRKKNKVQVQIEEIQKEMKQLSNKYEQRLNILIGIKEQIKDRKSVKCIGENNVKRIKATSAFQQSQKHIN